jgi:hypothetical protein
MRYLPADASDDEILALAWDWSEALAEDRYTDAFELVAAREHWTPELMKTVISNYGSTEPMWDHSVWHVTPLATALPSHDGLVGDQDVQRYDRETPDGRIGFVWFDLPLNGAWSDLTATFDIHRQGDRLFLELDDIHVM